MKSFLNRIRTAANEPIDNTFLVFFRIAFGGILLWGMMKYFRHDQIWTCFLEPKLHFTYYGFDMVRPFPGYGMYVLFLIIATAAACIMLGFRYQIAATIFFLSFTYSFLIDQSWYLNHYYLVCLLGFLLQFLPAEQSFSIDSWRDPTIASDTTPAWTLWLLRIQIGIPYVYGGIAKLNVDWINGEPMRTWMANATDFPVSGRLFTQEWGVQAFSYGGLLLDLFVIPLLLWKRTRWIALFAVSVFHLVNARLFNIGIFPWLMLAATFVLFLPDVVERLRFWGRRPNPSDAAENQRNLFELPSICKTMLITYLVFQLLIPFRHHLYPGSVALTREGHCFSWRMKLNIRDMKLDLKIHHADGRVEPLKLFQWVTWEQESRFRNLNQILQLARAVRQHHEAIDRQPVSVRGTITVSVNHGQPTVLVNEDVDLSRQRPSLFPARWLQTHPSRMSGRRLPVTAVYAGNRRTPLFGLASAEADR